MFSTAEEANLAANARTTNRLAGDINEFVTMPSVINVYAVSSAADVNLSMFADSDIAIEDKEIVAIGTTLDKSQHLLDSFAVGAGTRLSLFLRTTSAVATTDVLWGIEVLPL